MRLILGILLLSSGLSAASLVAHSCSSGGPNTVGTSAMNATGAKLLVAAIGYSLGSSPAIGDNYSNTWTPLNVYGPDTGAGMTRMYYAANATVGPGQTVTASGSSIYATICVAAFSGAGSFATQDGAVSASASSYQPGSVTPEIGGIVVAAVQPGTASVTIDSGFTITGQESTVGGVSYGCAIAYLISVSGSAVDPAWTPNSSGPATFATAVFSSGSAPASSGSQGFVF